MSEEKPGKSSDFSNIQENINQQQVSQMKRFM
jgi:hypothetical protein